MALTRINNERQLLDGTQVGDSRKDSITVLEHRFHAEIVAESTTRTKNVKTYNMITI